MTTFFSPCVGLNLKKILNSLTDLLPPAKCRLIPPPSHCIFVFAQSHCGLGRGAGGEEVQHPNSTILQILKKHSGTQLKRRIVQMVNSSIRGLALALCSTFIDTV